jgi:hypothetical protein
MVALSVTNRRRLLLLAALVLPLGALVLYTYPPDTTEWYPPCPTYDWAGLYCPGCGTGRGCYALLHGQFLQALAYNPLAMLVLPFLIVWAVRQAWTALRGSPPPGVFLSVRVRWAFVALVFVFAVLRNIPAYPFTLLAPHPLTPPDSTAAARPGPADRR